MGGFSERVRELYSAAGFSVACPPGPGALALRLLGEESVRLIRRAVAPVRSILAEDGWTLIVSERADPTLVCIGVARELARWWLYEDGLDVLAVPALQAFAEAIVLPDEAVITAVAARLTTDDIATQYICSPFVVRRRLQATHFGSGAYAIAITG